MALAAWKSYLQQVRRKRVSVFVQEASGVVEDNSCKVIEPERGVDVRLRLQVVRVVAVTPVQLVQHGLVRALQDKMINSLFLSISWHRLSEVVWLDIWLTLG